MKIQSLSLGLILVLLIWIILPALLIAGNNRLSLPVYGNFLLKAVGLLVFAVGLVSNLLIAYEHLKTGRVTPLPVERPVKLLRKGIYQYSRNPMYMTILLTFFGAFLFFGHFLLLIYVLLAIVAVHLIVVYKEEPELKRIFGKEYLDYCKKVPRWL